MPYQDGRSGAACVDGKRDAREPTPSTAPRAIGAETVQLESCAALRVRSA